MSASFAPGWWSASTRQRSHQLTLVAHGQIDGCENLRIVDGKPAPCHRASSKLYGMKGFIPRASLRAMVRMNLRARQLARARCRRRRLLGRSC